MKKILNSIYIRSLIPIIISTIIGINSNLLTSKNDIQLNKLFLNKNFLYIFISIIIFLLYQIYISIADKRKEEEAEKKLDQILINTTPKPEESDLEDNDQKIVNVNSDNIKIKISKLFVNNIKNLTAFEQIKINKFIDLISIQNISKILSNSFIHKIHKTEKYDAFIFKVLPKIRIVAFIYKEKNKIIFANIEKRI